MKSNELKTLKYLAIACVFTFGSISITSCGGGSSGGSGDTDTAGIGGTGIVVGKITDFGSIYVNGSKYSTTNSQFIVDGETGAGINQDDLAIGMIVRLQVEILNANFTANALKVIYDDEVQGPVAATPVNVPKTGGTQKTLQIFGQTITIDATTTVFDGTSFTALDTNDVIEVSGFRTSPTSINASYVRWIETLAVGSSEVELRGTINGYTPPTQQFMLNGFLITFDNMTEIEVPGGILQNGQYVEVEGVYQAGPRVHADEIELKDEDFGDDVDAISLQGIISNYVSDANFEIEGQVINASGAQFFPAGVSLGNGLEVEVEGEIVTGILVADELEVREGESKLETLVNPGSIIPANNRFEVYYPVVPGTVTIRVNAQTVFEDEAGPNPLDNFSINDLSGNDYVKIEGQETNNEVVATVVKRVDPDDYKLEGAVDDFSFADDWIEILGIRYSVNGGTEYEDGAMNAATFFGLLDINDLVEIEDDGAAPDGFADEVEFD